MKYVLATLITLILLSGCKDADHGEKFVGSWQQVNATEMAKLTAHITKGENGYMVEMGLTLPKQPAVVTSQVGKYVDGMLQVEGLEKIRFIESSGHIMIGVNEFARSQ
jgi:hypothetical protein